MAEEQDGGGTAAASEKASVGARTIRASVRVLEKTAKAHSSTATTTSTVRGGAGPTAASR